ncbi:MAG: hypothetical protein R3C16_09895 [Hyphomonadaceae bacterium]
MSASAFGVIGAHVAQRMRADRQAGRDNEPGRVDGAAEGAHAGTVADKADASVGDSHINLPARPFAAVIDRAVADQDVDAAGRLRRRRSGQHQGARHRQP